MTTSIPDVCLAVGNLRSPLTLYLNGLSFSGKNANKNVQKWITVQRIPQNT